MQTTQARLQLIDASRSDPRKHPAYGVTAALRFTISGYAVGRWPAEVRMLRVAGGEVALLDKARSPESRERAAELLCKLGLEDDDRSYLQRALSELA